MAAICARHFAWNVSGRPTSLACRARIRMTGLAGKISEHRRAAYLLGVGLLAAAYYGSAKLGLALAYENSSVTAVWAPTGLALGALLVGGYRMWPGVALGALLANTWTGVPVETVLGITTGNTLEALAGAWLLRSAGMRLDLDRVRDVVLLTMAAVLSPLVSATIGVASLRVGDSVVAENIPSVWRTWWLGDMVGDLVVAPVVLVAAAWVLAPRRPERLAEAALALTVLTAVTLVVFVQEDPVAYLAYPPLMWLALRFEQAGAVAGTLVLAAIAVVVTADGSGAFAQGTRDENLLLSQGFVGVAAITALLVAAVTSQRDRAEQETELERRRHALEIHDNIVQGLAVAKYAVDSGAHDQTRVAVEETLRRAQTLSTSLLSEDDPAPPPPLGSLRRSAPAVMEDEEKA
jgi:integral membrane sensor domain MASE1